MCVQNSLVNKILCSLSLSVNTGISHATKELCQPSESLNLSGLDVLICKVRRLGLRDH